MQDHWNQRFSQTDYLYGREANQFIQDISQKINIQGKTLAIAEGEGRNALFLTRQAKQKNTPFEIELWDYSEVALQKAQQHAHEENLFITTQHVDLEQVNWQHNAYHNIICVFGHFHETAQKTVLTGVRTSLQNGGWFIGEVYSQEQLQYGTGGPRDKVMLYHPKLFLELFQHDHIHHLFIGETERHEGTLHNGKCHVIQFAIQVNK